jgi:succinyl-CoA synthetase beta subunit
MSLLSDVKCKDDQLLISNFLVALFDVYRRLYFTYMEINPIVVKDGKVFILDLAAKVDQVKISNEKNIAQNFSRKK